MFHTITRTTSGVVIAVNRYSYDPSVEGAPSALSTGETACTEAEYEAARAALVAGH